jgi:hypothetical protein
VLVEKEPDFRHRAEAAINNYITNQKELAEARGLVEVSGKRHPRHFDWLALFQVKRWNCRQIAEWEQKQPGGKAVGDDTIGKGVRAAAKLCELNARAGQPGRPETQK